MGKRSRDRGAREERMTVDWFKSHGMDAKRIPLSGASEGFKGDIQVKGWLFEQKVRAQGFNRLYDWIDGDSDALILRANNRGRLFVFDEEAALALFRQAGWL